MLNGLVSVIPVVSEIEDGISVVKVPEIVWECVTFESIP